MGSWFSIKVPAQSADTTLWSVCSMPQSQLYISHSHYHTLGRKEKLPSRFSFRERTLEIERKSCCSSFIWARTIEEEVLLHNTSLNHHSNAYQFIRLIHSSFPAPSQSINHQPAQKLRSSAFVAFHLHLPANKTSPAFLPEQDEPSAPIPGCPNYR